MVVFDQPQTNDSLFGTQESNKRRPHKKSRNGCVTCKKKRVKCDEVHPTCSNCAKKNLSCTYKVIQERKVQKSFKFKDMTLNFAVGKQDSNKSNHELSPHFNNFNFKPASPTSDSNLTVSNTSEPRYSRVYLDFTKDYTRWSDITLELCAYFKLKFINKLYCKDKTELQYTLKLFDSVSLKYKFMKHIYLALAALDLYYNYEESLVDDEFSSLRSLDKFLFYRISLSHRSRCVQCFAPHVSGDFSESSKNAEYSEAVLMTSALIGAYSVCSIKYQFTDAAFYESFKGSTLFYKLGGKTGLKNTPDEIHGKYFSQENPEAKVDGCDFKTRVQTLEFPEMLLKLLEVQDFETQNSLVEEETPFVPNSTIISAPRRPKPSNESYTKISIKNILNVYDEGETTSRVSSHGRSFSFSSESNTASLVGSSSASSISNFSSISDDKGSQSSTSKETGESDRFGSIDNIDEQELQDYNMRTFRYDKIKCNSFKTKVYADSGKLKFENFYKELIKHIKTAYDKAYVNDWIFTTIRFASSACFLPDMKFLLENKDPRCLVLVSYFISLVSNLDNIWFYTCLRREISYIRSVLPQEWVPWTDLAAEMIEKNDPKRNLKSERGDSSVY